MADQSCGCEYSLRNARAMLDAIGRGVIAIDTSGAISLFREISELEHVVTELDVYRKMHRELDAVFESSSNSN